MSNEIILEDTYFIVSNKYKSGIFSLNTALFFHELTDRTPNQLNMVFPFGYNNPNLKKNNIIPTYETKNLFGIGKTTIETPYTNQVVVTGIERTLCDILRPKNNIDIAIIANAFKEYMTLPNKNFNKLYEYAKLLKVIEKVKSYLEVLQ